MSTFLLDKVFAKKLSKTAFVQAKQDYYDALAQNPFSIPNTSNTIELIQVLKRAVTDIGAYTNLTVFESINRIGTDLVLLSGTQKLFNNEVEGINPKYVLLRMGNKGGFDFEVETTEGELIYGEAFNAAPSFCKAKMRDAIHKLLDNPEKGTVDKAIVFYNDDVKSVIKQYTNQREETYPTFKIEKIPCEVE